MTDEFPWPADETYGTRFKEIDERLRRSFDLSEYRAATSDEHLAILRYRLAKLGIAAEDIRRSIKILEAGTYDDDTVSEALVELRGACQEVRDSFEEADESIIRLLNFIDREESPG